MHRFILFIVAAALLPGILHAQNESSASREDTFRERFIRHALEGHRRLSLDPAIRAKARELNRRRTEALRKGQDWDNYPVSDGIFAESEIHAVINPTDPDNIVVSAIRQVVVQGAIGDLTCPIYSTTDAGWTWSESAFRSEPTVPNVTLVGGGDPVLAFDADGRAYFTWLNAFLDTSFDRLYSELCWAYSDDGGWTWTQPASTVIAEANMMLEHTDARFVDKQWMAADRSSSPHRGNLYVAFARAAWRGMIICVSRREAGKDVFEPEVWVSPDSLGIVQYASIDVDEQGGVHVTYFGTTDGSRSALWHIRSTDGGKSFGEPSMVSNLIFPGLSDDDKLGNIRGITDRRLYPCPQMCVDRSRPGSVYMTWTASGVEQGKEDGADIYFARSTDYGATWGRPMPVNDDPRGVVVDQFYPSIAVNDDGVIAVTWYDRREDAEWNTSARYYFAVSRNGGESFSTNRPIATMPMDIYKAGDKNDLFGIGEYTQVLMTDDRIIPFWTDGRKNNGDLLIYSADIDLATLDVRSVAPFSADFRLLDVFPQPADAQVRMRFSLERRMPVRIVLTDLLGRSVRELPRHEYAAGEHAAELATEGLPAGGYQLMIVTPEGQAARMIRIY